MNKNYRVEMLLSARLLLRPQLVENTIYFISNLSGSFSLYSMKRGGSLPTPLLPPQIALQNPKLVGGLSYKVFPELGKILVITDNCGDEVYRPMFIPIDGGFPEAVFPDTFAKTRAFFVKAHIKENMAYFIAESLERAEYHTYRADLREDQITHLGWSKYENILVGASDDHKQALLLDLHTEGDGVLYLWKQETRRRKLIYGTPVCDRLATQEYPLNGINECFFTPNGAVLSRAAIFDDSFGLVRIDPEDTSCRPIEISGFEKPGPGELQHLHRITDRDYVLEYNINGCSVLCEGRLDEDEGEVTISNVILEKSTLGEGVVESFSHDPQSGDHVISFSTPTSPSQIYTLEGHDRTVVRHSEERILSIAQDHLSPGEDATFASHDGLTIPARLYVPSEKVGQKGPFPLVFYIHGGPQSQERPDFTWFSMPLIQLLTLNGIAVFVPNIRGSKGYGLSYTTQVDHDWGGRDRLDLVFAHETLSKDERLDLKRAGVMGRSYGGYMTLTLAGRHPNLWRAACDLFGPYNLLAFVERIPSAWRPYFYLAIGHPHKEQEFLKERSPSTYIKDIACPLLVIQGKNDPRVIEAESQQVVDVLRKDGKDVEYLVFEDEGHDICKFENRVVCYDRIVEFFCHNLFNGPQNE